MMAGGKWRVARGKWGTGVKEEAGTWGDASSFSKAEREGFEPSIPEGIRALQARALGQTMRPLPDARHYTTALLAAQNSWHIFALVPSRYTISP